MASYIRMHTAAIISDSIGMLCCDDKNIKFADGDVE
jgi:hypothetical protein